jgi:hypothetical protein
LKVIVRALAREIHDDDFISLFAAAAVFRRVSGAAGRRYLSK